MGVDLCYEDDVAHSHRALPLHEGPGPDIFTNRAINDGPDRGA
jgi:hypothetical protein